MTAQDPTPYPIPDGADALGVTGLFVAYNDARAAKIADPSEENVAAFQAAQAAVSDARAYWRGVGEYVAAAAYAEWAAANPEVAERVEAEVAERTAAAQDEEQA